VLKLSVLPALGSRLRAALQHTVTHCNTLEHTATDCNTLATQSYLEPSSVLQRVLPCVVVYCSVVPGSVLQCVVVCCSVLERGVLVVASCNILQSDAERYKEL